MKRNIHGIGTIEILIAMLIISTVFFGFIRLLNSSVKTAYYSNLQKLTHFAAQSMLDRINANRIINGSVASPLHYAEGTNWLSSNPTPQTMCDTNQCNQTQQRNYDLFKWHEYLATLKINSLKGIVCLDGNSPGIPTQNSPNCSGGSNLYIKLVWAHNLALVESGNVRNYLIVPVNEEISMALAAVDNQVNNTPAYSLDPTKMSAFWSTSWWAPMNYCSGSNVDCSNSAIFGTCGTSGSGSCAGSVIFGACYNSSQNCSNTVIYGQCDSANCNNSFVLGNCNGSSCQDAVVYGQCSGNCSRTVVAGNCTGLCDNTIVYGTCSGTCTNSVVYGSCTASNCSGTYVIGGSCPSGTCSGNASLVNSLTSTLNVTITGNTANNLLISKNTPNNYLIDKLQTGNQNGMQCSGADCSNRIMGQCANNSTCNGSAINGNCGNNAQCQSAIIDGNCNNNANCSNSIIKGNCGNNANCSNSQISGTCGNGANCSGSTCRAATANPGPC